MVPCQPVTKPLPPAYVGGQGALVREVDKRAVMLVAQGSRRRARDHVQVVHDAKGMRAESEIEIAGKRAIPGARLSKRVQSGNGAAGLTPAGYGQRRQGGAQAVAGHPQGPATIALQTLDFLVQRMPHAAERVIESFVYAPTERSVDEVEVQVGDPVLRPIGFRAPEADDDRLRIGRHKALRGFHVQEAELRVPPRRDHRTFHETGIGVGHFGGRCQLQGHREIEVMSRADVSRCWHS